MPIRRALLIAASALLVTTGRTVAQPTPAPAVSQILPSDTAGIFLLNPDPTVWEDLAKFGLFPRDFTTPGSLFTGIGGTSFGLNFYTDIEPWIGGQMGIVLLPGKGKSDTRSLILAPMKDSSAAAHFLDRLKTLRETPPLEQTYQGVKIWVWAPKKLQTGHPAPLHLPGQVNTFTAAAQTPSNPPRSSSRFPTPLQHSQASPPPRPEPLPLPPPPNLPEPPESPEHVPEIDAFIRPGFAIAQLPQGYVVSASRVEAIQRLIDIQARDTQHLSDNPAFQRTVQDPRFSRSLMAGYGNYAQLIASSLEDTPPIPQNPFFAPGPYRDRLAALIQAFETQYDGIDGFVWAEPEGLRMQGAVHLKKPIPADQLAQVNSPNLLPKQLPQVSYGVSTGYNLAFPWRAITTAIEANPTYKQSLSRLRKLSQNAVGLDDRDFFPWMDKEYGGLAFPTNQGVFPKMLPNLDLGLGVLIQTSDRAAAEKTLKKIDRLISSRFGNQVKVTPRELGGQPLTSWEIQDKGKPLSVMAHGWLAPDTLAVMSGFEAAPTLTPQPGKSLAESANFQAAIAPLPQPNLGYFYVNPAALIALANRFGFQEVLKTPDPNESDRTLGDILGSVRSLSGSSSATATTLSSDGFLSVASRKLPPLTASELIDLGDKKTMDYEGAIANYSRAIRLDPNNSTAYFKRAERRQQHEDYRGAIDDLDRTLTLDRKNILAYELRGEAKSQLYDFSGTVEDASQALALKPNSDLTAKAYNLRAYANLALENYRAVEEDTTAVLKLQPDNIPAYGNRCYARAQLKDFQNALTDCDRAIDLDQSSDYGAELFAARCYVRAGQKDPEALSDCGTAIEYDSTNPDVYEAQGLAREVLGDPKGAELSLKKARDLFQQKGDQVSVQRVEKAIDRLK